jgi:hypothetical protein
MNFEIYTRVPGDVGDDTAAPCVLCCRLACRSSVAANQSAFRCLILDYDVWRNANEEVLYYGSDAPSCCVFICPPRAHWLKDIACTHVCQSDELNILCGIAIGLQVQRLVFQRLYELVHKARHAAFNIRRLRKARMYLDAGGVYEYMTGWAVAHSRLL